ncbi:MAG: hypothetical protein OEW45_18195 [Deltaproteobacteria bacterium]|nr:hypothetical protein [Deltaproteobacteria bacterium]
MKQWEYQITRYQMQNLAPGEEIRGAAFYCDSKGQCLLHDTTKETTDIIRDVFNEEGKKGWELVQFGYHLGEILCVWKRLAT